MNSGKKWQHLLMHLLVITALLAVGLAKAQPTHADTICSLNNGCPVYAPPDLMYLDQAGMYAANAAQAVSLRNLQTQAIANIIQTHNLASSDTAAVQTWGRSEALAELYDLLVQAVNTNSRTSDQQNAVDWLTAVAQRQNIIAAQDAAREYVKWAGLDLGHFGSMLLSNASKSDLQTFLSGTPLNYNNTNTSAATGGWCVYRSPAPYGDEYKGYTDSTCFGPIAAITLPPTPSYDQFVEWGQAKANYSLLSNLSYLSTAQSVGIGLGIALPLGAVVAGSFPTSLALAQVASAANFASTFGEAADITSILETATTFSVGAAVSLVTTVLAAITAAILLGINVTDAANLPGKLATLIDTARTTPPDVSTLVSSSSGGTSLFSIFVGAATPSPQDRTCDNSMYVGGNAPGWYPLTQVSTDQVTMEGIAPCLNATDIPAASASDPQFLVTANGSSATQHVASSITWKDTASGSTTTARLSGNWFITQANGATAQTLHIAYTDWNGKEQNAWVMGDSTNGYEFLTYSPPTDASTTLDPKTCAAQGYCGASSVLQYIGTDGQHYSATVRGYKAPTGTPSYSQAIEGSPVSFNANGYAPGGAVVPITYQWLFQHGGCGIVACQNSDAASGATATYTWQGGGTNQVQLTATDAQGAQATDIIQVKVAGVPPTLTISPDCTVNPNVPCNTWTGDAGSTIHLSGTAGHAGNLDNEYVTVNWGDGSYADEAGAGPNIGNLLGNPLTVTNSTSQSLMDDIKGTHTYANPGTYYGTVSVADTNGGADSTTFTMTIMGTQAITFGAIGGHSYGDVFSISATGGASGQPVTIAVTSNPPACALSNVTGGAGTGSATVTVLSVGYCNIAANQAGTATYHPAPTAMQQVVNLLAVLTVTAPSPSITYGQATPVITPTYTGFKNGDTATVLTTPATCTVAPNNGAAGTYATTCAGAAAANYGPRYVAGTLTINPAPLTIMANNKAMIYGGPVPSFDAQYSGLLNGDTNGVVTGLSCVAKDASGQAASSSTPAGSYPITCGGGSAANYSPSYVAGTLTINKASTSTTLSSAPSPAVYGQAVTFTASISVSSPGSGHPGGTVAFKDGGNNIAGCAAQPVDTASGKATCITTALSVGQHSVTVTYNGDSNFIGSSTAVALAQTVNKAAVNTTLSAAANPSTSGQTVIFTVAVAAAAPGTGVATGTVTFKDGTTTLGTGTLSTSNGVTSTIFKVSSLSVGQHAITASYSGDGNFLAGTSATLTQYVNTNLSNYPRLSNGAYNLSNMNLVGGYFVNAALAGASVKGSNLTGAVFLGANLAGADLTNSNLKGANLTGANLTGANLTGATLKGAVGLTAGAVTNAIWSQTTCPDSTISNNNGGTCIGHF